MSAKERPHSVPQRLSLLTVLGHLGWPILLGLAATSVFFILVYRGPLNLPIMHRYFASHPVTFAETALFFIGMASLLLKLFEVMGQYMVLGGVKFQTPAEGGQSPEDAETLLAELDQLDARTRTSHLVARLRDALEYVRRTGSADHLNDELKYLADMDAAKQQDAYSLVRIVIWATPMLGFLGTVMGITQALGDLSANSKMLATAIDTAIQGLLGGLYVAFDTTALALTLSMILMFLQFIIDRAEVQLLAAIDTRASAELVGRFEVLGFSSDPQVATVERMAHAVVKSTESLVQRQAQLWQSSLEDAQRQWHDLFQSTSQNVKEAVDDALEASVGQHAEQLATAEQAVLEQSRQGWEKIHGELARQTAQVQAQQANLTRQGEILAEVLHATGDVIKLEQALNANLASLAGAKNFEDTVMSLSAAIHLLTARLGRTNDGTHVDLSKAGGAIAGTIRPDVESSSAGSVAARDTVRQGKAA